MSKLEIFEVSVPQLDSTRTVRVYLPAEYFQNNKKKLPVLYMHDGQNLFDDKTAFCGKSWDARKTLDNLIGKKVIPPMIIVGVDNGDDQRRFEYSPWVNSYGGELLGLSHSIGGKGDAYADFFVNTLMDIINKKYRVLTDFNNTFISGSSLGSFISIYIMAKYPDRFSKVGAFSTASWAAEECFLKYIKSSALGKNEAFYIYVGTKETSNQFLPNFPKIYQDCSENLKDALIENGCDEKSIKYVVGENEIHNEASWRKFFPDFIKWIFE